MKASKDKTLQWRKAFTRNALRAVQLGKPSIFKHDGVYWAIYPKDRPPVAVRYIFPDPAARSR